MPFVVGVFQPGDGRRARANELGELALREPCSRAQLVKPAGDIEVGSLYGTGWSLTIPAG